MRLNLGCGDRYAEGWTNVDHAGSPHRKDQTVDLTGELPWEPGTVELAYAGHVLEHLTVETCDLLLRRLLPCMMPAGILLVVGPDLDRAEAMVNGGTFDFRYGHTLDSLRHGGHRWPGDEHRWASTAPATVDLLTGAGWSEVTDIGIGAVGPTWPVADRAPLWQFAIVARGSVS
jgi:predicted SAM-dependent methyltransferase